MLPVGPPPPPTAHQALDKPSDARATTVIATTTTTVDTSAGVSKVIGSEAPNPAMQRAEIARATVTGYASSLAGATAQLNDDTTMLGAIHARLRHLDTNARAAVRAINECGTDEAAQVAELEQAMFAFRGALTRRFEGQRPADPTAPLDASLLERFGEVDLLKMAKEGHSAAMNCLKGRLELAISQAAGARMATTAKSKDSHIVADIVQETWRKLLELDTTTLDGLQSMRGFACRIAANLATDYVRSAHVRRVGNNTGDSLSNVTDGANEALHASDLEVIRSRLGRALATLPVEQRAAFLLVKVEGQTFDAAAETLRLPVGTVKTQVRTALGKLRVELGEFYEKTFGSPGSE